VGALAAINASQWRNTSYRYEDGAYREQIRQIASTRALIADTLLVSGIIAGGTGYYLQRKAVAGPMGKMTIGWGQDTWREPDSAPTEPSDQSDEDTKPASDADQPETIKPWFNRAIDSEAKEGARP
jgi:hypothetical protein